MFHNYNIYYFTDEFNSAELKTLDKSIDIIYRNYSNKKDFTTIHKLSIFCKLNNRKLYISNNIKLALKLNLDGLYLPSFNKILKYKNLNLKQNFKIIGSAHNLVDIKIKELQGCTEIFLAPIFNNLKNKKYLDLVKFSLLTLKTNKKIVALGGINEKNFKKLKLVKIYGFAAILWIKKNRPKKLGRFI